MYAILSGCLPFYGNTPKEVFERIRAAKINFELNKLVIEGALATYDSGLFSACADVGGTKDALVAKNGLSRVLVLVEECLEGLVFLR
jgi:hypothetical protein